MEKKIETTMVYWRFIGIMEKNMEATIVQWDMSWVVRRTAALRMQESLASTAAYLRRVCARGSV